MVFQHLSNPVRARQLPELVEVMEVRHFWPVAEEYDEDIGGRLSFKVINPKVLLKYEE